MNQTQITEEHLKQLLYAVSNIGGNASPETDDGIIYSQAALLMATKLFPTLAELRAQMVNFGYGVTQEQRDEFNPLTVEIDMDVVNDGFIQAVTLWLECMKAENPVEHAEKEIAKGLNGERVE